MKEKAYKLLALQEKISNSKAKELIDRGLVFYKNEKLKLARELLSKSAKFVVKKQKKIEIIFEDEKIIAVNKPFAMLSAEVEKSIQARLLNRLDKETSGLLLLCKNEDFRLKCINEFKKQNVYKSYIAVLNGIVPEVLEIDEPILVKKTQNKAFAKISKEGQSAYTKIIPLMINAKKTLAKIIIKTGRTHQIRLHTAFAGYGVVGDERYAKIPSQRMYLHSFECAIFDYHFRADLDESFEKFGFELKNLNFKDL